MDEHRKLREDTAAMLTTNRKENRYQCK